MFLSGDNRKVTKTLPIPAGDAKAFWFCSVLFRCQLVTVLSVDQLKEPSQEQHQSLSQETKQRPTQLMTSLQPIAMSPR